MQILQANIGLRVLREELLQAAVHVVQADGIDRGHPNPACDIVVQGAYLFFQGKIPFHELAAAVVVDLAFRGQRKWPFRAVDELDSQAAFQLVNYLAGTGLGNGVFLRGFGKAAAVNYVAKDFK